MELQRYTTYLRPEQVKWVKIQAVNDGAHDYDIMQEAVDRYFEGFAEGYPNGVELASRGITEPTKPRMADTPDANPNPTKEVIEP